MRVLARHGIRAVDPHQRRRRHQSRLQSGRAGRAARPHQSAGRESADRPERRTLRPALSGHDARVLQAISANCARSEAEKLGIHDSEGVYAALAVRATKLPRKFATSNNRRGSGRDVHRAGSDRRAPRGYRRAGNFLRHKHGGRNSRSADRSRRSLENYGASPKSFRSAIQRNFAKIGRNYKNMKNKKNDLALLIDAARTARKNAHAPFSKFKVGAAVRAKSQKHLFRLQRRKRQLRPNSLRRANRNFQSRLRRRAQRLRCNRSRHRYAEPHSSVRRLPPNHLGILRRHQSSARKSKRENSIISHERAFPAPIRRRQL